MVDRIGNLEYRLSIRLYYLAGSADTKGMTMEDILNYVVTQTRTVSVVAIRVRYIPPTTYLSSRLRVWRADGKYRNDPDRMTVVWESGENTETNVESAVHHYLYRKSEAWQGKWVVASLGNDEWVAIKEGK